MIRVSIVVVVIFVNTTLFSTMNSTNDNKGVKSAFHFFVGINLSFCCCCLIHCHIQNDNLSCCCCCLIYCCIQFDVLLSFVEFIVENNVVFTKMTTTTTMDTLFLSIFGYTLFYNILASYKFKLVRDQKYRLPITQLLHVCTYLYT